MRGPWALVTFTSPVKEPGHCDGGERREGCRILDRHSPHCPLPSSGMAVYHTTCHLQLKERSPASGSNFWDEVGTWAMEKTQPHDRWARLPW